MGSANPNDLSINCPALANRRELFFRTFAAGEWNNYSVGILFKRTSTIILPEHLIDGLIGSLGISGGIATANGARPFSNLRFGLSLHLMDNGSATAFQLYKMHCRWLT